MTNPAASAVLDAANGLYSLMLRCLQQCYETPWEHEAARAAIVNATFRTMHAFAGVACDLTTMPARDNDDERAGVSFAMLRATEGAAHGLGGWAALTERLSEIRACASALPLPGPSLHRVEVDLARVAESLASGENDAPGGVAGACVRSQQSFERARTRSAAVKSESRAAHGA